MPYQKIKTASFLNMGGINTKTSPYIVGQNEFTNIVNIDFQQPGSLTKRWGSSMYVGATLSTKITGVYEYQTAPINGFFSDVVVVTGQSSLLQTFGSGYQTLFNHLGFTSFIGGTNLSADIYATFVSTGFTWYLGGTFWYDFENYTNALWGTNGNNIWKFDGNFKFFSLPAAISPLKAGATYVIGGSGNANGMTGVYVYNIGYQNDRGYFGPLSVTNFPVITAGATNVIISTSLPIVTSYGFDVNYGITAAIVYRAGPYPADVPANQLTYTNIGLFPFNGQTFVDNNLLASATLAPTSIGLSPEIWGGTGIANLQSQNGRSDYLLNNAVVFRPKYLELYNNQMFFSGFNATPSTVWFSDIGEPESIQPEFNFQVRTNDGDLVRGMKAYLSSLLIFKTNSFHRLSGQDPQNFALSEMSAQYGCVSNRAICVAKNTCYFLDRKGVIAFNGANVDIISNKIDPIFARMNYPAALDQAIMTYDKVRNEILVEIPIDGSATNNFTVVYDIIVGAWTTYQGINASSATIARGTLNNFSYIYGNYSGALLNVGASYLSDNGTAYTALIQTRFFNEIDPATTKQWRRIFFNVDPVPGSTLQVDLIANYGASVSETRFFQQTPYLSRIDFGIPSTALSFTLTNFSAVDTLKLHGFTVEYRFQRGVQDIET